MLWCAILLYAVLVYAGLCCGITLYFTDTNTDTPSNPSTAVSDRKATAAYSRLNASLPMMYTSAIRYTVGSKGSLDQAQKLMDHQRAHDVTPMWSCTRYAKAAAFAVAVVVVVASTVAVVMESL